MYMYNIVYVNKSLKLHAVESSDVSFSQNLFTMYEFFIKRYLWVTFLMRGKNYR